MTRRQYEDYNFKTDTEHKALFGGRLPGTREEEIYWAGVLANMTGKRVRINAMSIIPDTPISTGEKIIRFVSTVVTVAFLALIALGGLLAIAAILTGNGPR